jgi:hypothetical protein
MAELPKDKPLVCSVFLLDERGKSNFLLLVDTLRKKDLRENLRTTKYG